MQNSIFQFSSDKLIGIEKESFPMNLYLYMQEMILFIATKVLGLKRQHHRGSTGNGPETEIFHTRNRIF